MNQNVIWPHCLGNIKDRLPVFLLVLFFFHHQALAAAKQEMGQKLFLVITIDVETTAGCKSTGCFPESMESRILGQHNGKYYGIPLMMDILEQNNMRATFFVNAYLDAYYNEQDVSNIVAQIVRRGHDVQFHAHEEFRCFNWCEEADKACWQRCTQSESFISGNSSSNQYSILKEGALNIKKWSGRYPVAFRGGGFDADINTLKALRSLNIPIDSSLSNPYHNLANHLEINKISEYEGVVEIPLFNYVELGIGPYKKFRMFDIESTTLLELKILLNRAIKERLGTITLLMHSFSFCRPEIACPMVQNIDRFSKFLGYVNANKNVETITMEEFWRKYSSDKKGLIGSGFMPETGYLLTLYRSFVRFNHGINNQIFAIANILMVLVMVLVGYFVINKYRKP